MYFFGQDTLSRILSASFDVLDLHLLYVGACLLLIDSAKVYHVDVTAGIE